MALIDFQLANLVALPGVFGRPIKLHVLDSFAQMPLLTMGVFYSNVMVFYLE